MSIRNITLSDISNEAEALRPAIKAALKAGIEMPNGADTAAKVLKGTVNPVLAALTQYRGMLETRAEKTELSNLILNARNAARGLVGLEPMTLTRPRKDGAAPSGRRGKRSKKKAARVRRTEHAADSTAAPSNLEELLGSFTTLVFSENTAGASGEEKAEMYSNDDGTSYAVTGPGISFVNVFETAHEAAAVYAEQFAS